MRNPRLPAAIVALALAATPAFAKGSGSAHSGSHAHSSHSSSLHSTSGHKAGSAAHSGTHRAVGVPRDSHGKIARSSSARSSFMHSHPCPSTGKISGACPGYVVDHITPLKRGGADGPSNMQWQTKEAAKAKDKTE
jgi:hypothetical protein